MPGRCEAPYSETQVTDQTGETNKRADSRCYELPNVDEGCVNEQIKVGANGLGTSTGRWCPLGNDCQSFVDNVIDKSSVGIRAPVHDIIDRDHSEDGELLC